MAGPITHIVISERLLEKFILKTPVVKDFILGTSFPDIRYLAKIEREKTHFKVENIDDIDKVNSFKAGLQFHSYVDIFTNKYIREKNVFSFCPESPFTHTIIKFLEDKYFYDRSNNWNKYIDYFKDVTSDELSIGVDRENISKWHTALVSYLSEEPTDESAIRYGSVIGFSQELISKLLIDLEAVSKIKEVNEYIEDFYNNFEGLLKV